MKFQIKARLTNEVKFECELDASFETQPRSIQLGAAVKLAIKARANLAGADLAGAYLAGADLADAYLAGADLADAYQLKPEDVPTIPQIDAKILAAIEAGGTLDMGSWHGRDGICGTRHCRAGWAVHLAGEPGKALEAKIGTKWAATEIYRASRPGQRAPWFFDSNEGALADLRKCAAEQTKGDTAP